MLSTFWLSLLQGDVINPPFWRLPNSTAERFRAMLFVALLPSDRKFLHAACFLSSFASTPKLSPLCERSKKLAQCKYLNVYDYFWTQNILRMISICLLNKLHSGFSHGFMCCFLIVILHWLLPGWRLMIHIDESSVEYKIVDPLLSRYLCIQCIECHKSLSYLE